MKKIIELNFGALCPSIAEQLAKQNLYFKTKKDESRCQHYADSLTSLFIRGLLTASEVHKARKRLFVLIKGVLK